MAPATVTVAALSCAVVAVTCADVNVNKKAPAVVRVPVHELNVANVKAPVNVNVVVPVGPSAPHNHITSHHASHHASHHITSHQIAITTEQQTTGHVLYVPKVFAKRA